MISTTVSICFLIFISIIMLVFLLKPRVAKVENKIFELMMYSNVFGLVCQILSYFLITKINNFYDTSFYVFILKMIFCYYLLYEILFCHYIYSITFVGKNGSIKKGIKLKILYLLMYFFAVMALFSKMEVHVINDMYYPAGISFVFLIIAFTICLLIILYCLVANYKRILSFKFLPLLVFIIFGVPAIILQIVNPNYLLVTPIETLVLVILYFTLENPDVKMLEEFRKNKEFGEAVNREKELFLFNLTKEIRNPLNDIGAACDQLNLMTDNKEIKKGVHYINYKKNNCLATINNMLDTSNMDINRIKVYETKYNTKLLFDEITRIVKKDVKDGVDLRINIDKSIPEKLYGDSIRIKQILKILLDNSCKHTNQGFIELEAHEITKNDICRLIITIEDSGTGIEIDKLDKIFSSSNVEIVDDSRDNLVTAKSLSVVMGGLLTFTSELGKGTKFTFVVDQKIDDEKSKELKKIEEYTKLITKDNIIVVSEDKDYLDKITKKLSKNNFEVSSLDYGSKCLQKLRHNTNYKYIILDEDLSVINIDDMLTKLREIQDFKSKVYILTKNTKTDKYLKRGFDGILSKRLTIKDIDNLTK